MGAGIVNVDLKDILSNAGSIFTGFGGFLTSVREVITGKKILDPNKAAELEAQALALELKIKEIDQSIQIAQIEINKIEAVKPGFFNAWRPATGWLCVTGLAWSTFIYPIWVWIAKLANIVQPPTLDVAVLVTLLIGMLGVGTMRSYDKKQGTNS